MKSAEMRLVLCIASIIGINIVHKRLVLTVVLIAVLVLSVHRVYKSNNSYRNIMLTLMAAVGFSILQAVSVGDTIFYRISIGTVGLNIYQEGLNKAVLTFLKIAASMLLLMNLVGSITISQFVHILEKSRLPRAFVEVAVITIKFIFSFKEDVSTVRKAQKARMGYSGFWRSANSIGTAGGIVLTRAIDRSEILAKAMKSRGCSESFTAKSQEKKEYEGT